MDDVILVITTFDNYKVAEDTGEELLKKKLCACYQIIGPIKSIYWWKDNIEKSDEWICFIKSKKEKFKEVEETIKCLHPYEVPEIISIPILKISEKYLNWINSII
uniref:Divalent-cation tolerance protein CutA n=1 Tax=candidate division WOR-3 bacterium TaxID=2052148 RepID=A0A7C3UNM2_UNCW3